MSYSQELKDLRKDFDAYAGQIKGMAARSMAAYEQDKIDEQSAQSIFDAGHGRARRPLKSQVTATQSDETLAEEIFQASLDRPGAVPSGPGRHAGADVQNDDEAEALANQIFSASGGK